MKVLGIETATVVCGAALVKDGIVVRNEQIAEKNIHAESIMLLIDRVLKHANMTVQSIDALAVSIGPGSFTGLRIGLSVAKGLCYATGKPLVAVPTLRALAQRAVGEGAVSTSYILPAIDARRDEVYCQLFRVNGGEALAEWDERDFAVGRLLEQLDGKSCTITGDGAQKIQRHAGEANLRFLSGPASECSAATVAKLGEQMALRGEFVDSVTVEPKYVKEFYTKLSN
ncbi:MAG: tRNA (adenosine(37)-N6)-threonylcarbamoyltransferase complex dimerization subunit type 1 TsaB [Ignavibacteriae bacterium]|nr:tRNA (adenosine(37)-N6)-threonylcarbamoyltransferase complex dimerization subunit type 1 TsaB [Ignavibacteriota bacterium]